MSFIIPAPVTCAGCGAAIELPVVVSINADRRKDLLRAAIDDTLQRGACAACGEPFRLEPEFTWLHASNASWWLVKPLASLADWRELEDTAMRLHAETFSPTAPPAARAIGDGLRSRVVFGWYAFREKRCATPSASTTSTSSS